MEEERKTKEFYYSEPDIIRLTAQASDYTNGEANKGSHRATTCLIVTAEEDTDDDEHEDKGKSGDEKRGSVFWPMCDGVDRDKEMVLLTTQADIIPIDDGTEDKQGDGNDLAEINPEMEPLPK